MTCSDLLLFGFVCCLLLWGGFWLWAFVDARYILSDTATAKALAYIDAKGGTATGFDLTRECLGVARGYVLLSRLEDPLFLVESREIENGNGRREYRITEQGRAWLRRHRGES